MATKPVPNNLVTIQGDLSFPVFSHAEAVVRNAKSQFPMADPNDVKPEFNLLVGQAQLDKLTKFLLDEYLPEVEGLIKDGNKKFEKLTVKKLGVLRAAIEAGDWAEPVGATLAIKQVPEKTQEMRPNAVASIKIVGDKGRDLQQRAIVRQESELKVPDPELVAYPVLKPIHETHHELYAGCLAAATIGAYIYLASGGIGIGFGTSIVVFKADGEPLGGGTVIDEDAIFED